MAGNKKLRFDARNPSALATEEDEEDLILEADTIGKRGAQTKRNAAVVDGFDSDSSNEGFDARAEKKAKASKQAAQSADADQDDMFGDLEEKFADGDEDETGAVSGKKRKRDVTLLDMDDIEGQSRKSKSGGHVSSNLLKNPDSTAKDDEVESSSDEEVPDEQRADIGDIDEEIGAGGKKKHAPKLDAFNLSNEKEEGGFDEHGNFVRKAFDPNNVYDTWMDGVSKKDMKKAREAHDARTKEQKQKRIQDDARTMGEILGELIARMDSGETVLEALSRLGKAKEKKKTSWKDKRRIKKGIDMDVDERNGEDSAETERKAAIEALTESADLLLSRGDIEIYEKDREQLVRAYKKETGEDWQEKSDTSRQWYYRWADARDGGESHGPYDGPTMLAWNDAGYFGEGVEFQRADDQSGPWHAEVEF